MRSFIVADEVDRGKILFVLGIYEDPFPTAGGISRMILWA
jgi:hypothetical protein